MRYAKRTKEASRCVSQCWKPGLVVVGRLGEDGPMSEARRRRGETSQVAWRTESYELDAAVVQEQEYAGRVSSW